MKGPGCGTNNRAPPGVPGHPKQPQAAGFLAHLRIRKACSFPEKQLLSPSVGRGTWFQGGCEGNGKRFVGIESASFLRSELAAPNLRRIRFANLGKA